MFVVKLTIVYFSSVKCLAQCKNCRALSAGSLLQILISPQNSSIVGALQYWIVGVSLLNHIICPLHPQHTSHEAVTFIAFRYIQSPLIKKKKKDQTGLLRFYKTHISYFSVHSVFVLFHADPELTACVCVYTFDCIGLHMIYWLQVIHYIY